MKKTLSIIMPIYRQETTIQKDLGTIFDCLKKSKLDFEIIAVIDGRGDQSFEEITKLKKKEVSAYQLEKNHGKGYAIRYGMARSHGELVAFIDAGMEIEPEALLNLLEIQRRKKADIVIGSKRHPESVVSYPFFRRVLSFGYQVLVLLLFGLSVRDTQVGVKVFRRQVLEDVLPRLLVKRYAFDIEILAVAHHLGYKKIIEAPITLHYNFSQFTTAGSWGVIQRMLIDTLAVFYRLRIKQYYESGNKRRWVYDQDLDMKINVG